MLQNFFHDFQFSGSSGSPSPSTTQYSGHCQQALQAESSISAAVIPMPYSFTTPALESMSASWHSKAASWMISFSPETLRTSPACLVLSELIPAITSYSAFYTRIRHFYYRFHMRVTNCLYHSLLPATVGKCRRKRCCWNVCFS